MKVATFYEPIQRELGLVDQTLGAIRGAAADFPELVQMLDLVLGGGGKRVRPAIALLAGKFGSYQPELLVPLATSIELLHTATLVHDDVIDRAPTRRGRPTANSVWNNASAVMLGDYMFAHAAGLIARTNSIPVVKLFARTLMAMASGELDQDMTAYDYGRDTMSYFDRIAGKTASLFATSAQGGAMVGGAPEEQVRALRDYGENVGMAFQVVDDILDFTGDEVQMGKPVGSDLMQGTLTLPSLLLMERFPRGNPVQKLFRNRRRAEHLAAAIDMIQNSDILDEAYRVAEDFGERARRSLEGVPEATARACLADIVDFVLERRA